MSAPSPLRTDEWNWGSSGRKAREHQRREWGKCSYPLSPCWQDSKKDNLGDKMKEFMHKYDKNADGKIEMAEVSSAGPDKPRVVHVPPPCSCFPSTIPPCLCSPQLAQILPTEENFLLCFRQHVGSSSEFMEVSGAGCAGGSPGNSVQLHHGKTTGNLNCPNLP